MDAEGLEFDNWNPADGGAGRYFRESGAGAEAAPIEVQQTLMLIGVRTERVQEVLK